MKPARPAPSADAGQRVDRLPPHASDAEAGILGCILTAPGDTMPAALEAIPDKTFFFDLRHQHLWETCRRVFADKNNFDLILICSALTAEGALNTCGGVAYLSGLLDVIPSTSLLPHYLDIAREAWLGRRLLRAAGEMIDQVYASAGSGAVVGAATTALAAIADATTAIRARPRRVAEYLPAFVDRLEAFQRGKKQMLGLSTGLNYWDNMTCGIGPEDYWILAGRPGTGKTALALNLCEHLAVNQGIPVAMFSLEMSGLSLTTRAVFIRAQADAMKYRNGFLADRDMPPIVAAIGQLKDAPLWILDEAGLTVDRLEIQARRMAREHGVRLFVLDYVQLMRGRQGQRYEKRVEELADVSRAIMALKKELKVPWLVLAQMNREYDKEPRRPQLSDLKDCGNFEQDADSVSFLWPEDMSICRTKPDSDKAKDKLAFLDTRSVQTLPAEFRSDWAKCLLRVNLTVAKQREGPTGDVELVRVNPWMRFIDAYRPSRHTGAAAAAQDHFDADPSSTGQIFES